MMRFCLILSVISLGGCATFQPPKAPVSNYCQIAKPLYWSSQDTRATKEQADIQNRQWKRLCK